jgi:phosphatidylserine/phosphatidylglycerophosphate/cardiolipin synthase-like enzyme
MTATNAAPHAPTIHAAPVVHAFNNTSSVLLAWSIDRPYDDSPPCLGFKIIRSIKGRPDVVLPNFVGFKGVTDPKPQPSDRWPFQRFTWSDFGVQREMMEQISVGYTVTPVFGDPPADGTIDYTAFVEGTPSNTAWTEPVPEDAPLQGYFNFGIVASGWFTETANKLDADGALQNVIFRKGKPAHDSSSRARAKRGTLWQDSDPRKNALNELLDKAMPDGSGLTMRERLGGALLKRLYKLLDDAAADPGSEIYTAFFELGEPHIIERLNKLGKRAHVILGNSSHKGSDLDPEAEVAKAVKGIDLHRRILRGSGAYAHNKFIVVTKNKRPVQVWTGSTNVTTTGCATQVNNGLLIEDDAIAKAYLDQWNWLKKCGNEYKPPAELETTQDVDHAAKVSVFFTPTGKQHTSGGKKTTDPDPLPDLGYCADLIAGAKEGILCLFFNPGPSGTLLNDIIDIAKKHPDKLYVRGVVNNDPSTLRRNKQTGKLQGTNVAGLLHQDKGIPAAFDIVLPSALATGAASDAFFEAERDGFDIVKIHSKVVVIDPTGAHPVVITGSHNLGPKASTVNDENLVIVEGDPGLARAYAAHIMSVFNHFWFNFNSSPQAAKYATHAAESAGSHFKDRVKPWDGLQRSGGWQRKFFQKGSPESTEFAFWNPGHESGEVP